VNEIGDEQTRQLAGSSAEFEHRRPNAAGPEHW
jgi:hypothetical protein